MGTGNRQVSGTEVAASGVLAPVITDCTWRYNLEAPNPSDPENYEVRIRGQFSNTLNAFYPETRWKEWVEGDVVEGRMIVTPDGGLTWNGTSGVRRFATKTDSLGSTYRSSDAALIYDGWSTLQLEGVLRADGFYVSANGRRVILMLDFVTDRRTGVQTVFYNPVVYAGTQSRWTNLGGGANLGPGAGGIMPNRGPLPSEYESMLP
jgi:hypothetical protein